MTSTEGKSIVNGYIDALPLNISIGAKARQVRMDLQMGKYTFSYL